MTILFEDEPSPSRSLDSSSGGIKLLFHRIDRAKVAIDGVCERTWLEDATTASTMLGTMSSWSKILPKERVVDMTWMLKIRIDEIAFRGIPTATVEFVSSLERNPLARGCSRNQRLFSRVETVYIGLMMLLMMEGHNLLTDEGFESIIAVWELRKSLLGVN